MGCGLDVGVSFGHWLRWWREDGREVKGMVGGRFLLWDDKLSRPDSQRCDPTGLVITSFRYTCDPTRLVITDAIAAAQPDAGVWSESAGCETLRVPRFPVPTTLCAMDPHAGAIESPTPKQKAAARELDRRMNYE